MLPKPPLAKPCRCSGTRSPARAGDGSTPATLAGLRVLAGLIVHALPPRRARLQRRQSLAAPRDYTSSP